MKVFAPVKALFPAAVTSPPPAEIVAYSSAVPPEFTLKTCNALPKAVRPVPPLPTGRVPLTSFANLTVRVLLAPLMVLLVSVPDVARPTKVSVAAGNVRVPLAAAVATIEVVPLVAPAMVNPPLPIAGVVRDGLVARTILPVPVVPLLKLVAAI